MLKPAEKGSVKILPGVFREYSPAYSVKEWT